MVTDRSRDGGFPELKPSKSKGWVHHFHIPVLPLAGSDGDKWEKGWMRSISSQIRIPNPLNLQKNPPMARTLGHWFTTMLILTEHTISSSNSELLHQTLTTFLKVSSGNFTAQFWPFSSFPRIIAVILFIFYRGFDL